MGAERYGGKTALLYHGEELSSADIESRANRITNAFADEDSFPWMVDRADDMIVGGENVCPAEVESALFGHSGVEEAAVVAAPHEANGEAPIAYVVPEDGADLSEDELREFAIEHVATHAYPRRVFFGRSSLAGIRRVRRDKLEGRAETDLDGPLTSREAA